MEVAWEWCETQLLLLLPMPSVVHDNLRPEAGLEDWRGEMGSAVSDWVAPQAPGFIHLQPRRLSLLVLVSTYPALTKDKKGQEHKKCGHGSGGMYPIKQVLGRHDICPTLYTIGSSDKIFTPYKCVICDIVHSLLNSVNALNINNLGLFCEKWAR